MDKHFFDELKEIQEQKAKRYCAVMWSRNTITDQDIEKLNGLRNIAVSQQTPLRVLHRRSQLVRDKYIYRMKAVKVNDNYAILHLLAGAGTYIKEFVHGDIGRTIPSVGTLINHPDVDILQLDVMEVYDSLGAIDVESPDLFDVNIIKLPQK